MVEEQTWLGGSFSNRNGSGETAATVAVLNWLKGPGGSGGRKAEEMRKRGGREAAEMWQQRQDNNDHGGANLAWQQQQGNGKATARRQ